MNEKNCQVKDQIQQNIELIERLFPSVVKEVPGPTGERVKRVDMEALGTLLGEDPLCPEVYEFSWPGKRQARLEAERPSEKALVSVGEEEATANLYIEGDNLEALKLLRQDYQGAVKVMYIDPPYNTKSNLIYDDNFTLTEEEYRTRQGLNVQGECCSTDNDGRYHAGWCSMIYSRLMVARQLLKEDGTIFISIDDNEEENLKKICDEVFGEKNFVNAFIWNCSTAGGIRPKFASKAHEYVFCYAKDKASLRPFSAPLSADATRLYNQRDEEGRLYRDKDFVFKNKSQSPNQRYEIICPDGQKVHPKEGYIYRFVRSTFDEALAEGLVSFKGSKSGPLVDERGEQARWNIYIKKYLGDGKGAPSTLIPKELAGIYNGGTRLVQDLFDGERVFDNVKPVNLIKYLINMVAEDGDLVMDFFSGSATTAQAVMESELERGIDLSYIMIQSPEACSPKSRAYKAGYRNICQIGEERIRRAAKSLESHLGAKERDFGFKVYKVE